MLFLYISIIPEPDRGINSSVCKEQTVRKQSVPYCVYNEAAEDTEKRNKKMDKKQISEKTEEIVKGSVPSRGEIPVYERYKGKQMHGSKTWQATEKEQRTVKFLGAAFVVLTLLALVSPLLPVSAEVRAVLFILSITVGIGGMGGYLFYMVYRHHKEDPIEMHYYDVDYEKNLLTGKNRDDSKEIRKDEFYNK